MQCKENVSRMAILIGILALILSTIGCAGPSKPVQTNEVMQTEWQVTPEAQITQFNWETGEHKNQPALIFTVTVKNICNDPQRYRLNIFLMDKDKAVGHLIPRKGKPPLLAPGDAKTVKIPFIQSTEPSNHILVVVKTIGY